MVIGGSSCADAVATLEILAWGCSRWDEDLRSRAFTHGSEGHGASTLTLVWDHPGASTWRTQ